MQRVKGTKEEEAGGGTQLRRLTGLEEVTLHPGLDAQEEVGAGRKGPSDDSDWGWRVGESV